MVDHLQQLIRRAAGVRTRVAGLGVAALLPALTGVGLAAQTASADGGTWRVTTAFYHGEFQVALDVTCDAQGTCQGSFGPWQITLTFSGNIVRVRGSNGFSTVTGSGQANGAWPDCNFASGSDSIFSPGGTADQETWQATRTSAPSTPAPNPPTNPPETSSPAPNPPATESASPGGSPEPNQSSGPPPSGGQTFVAGLALPSDLPRDPPAFPNVRTIAGGGTQTIVVGTSVYMNAGAKFATDSRTSAHIEFADGTKIDIGPNSRLTLGPDGAPVWGWFEEGILHFSGSKFERPYFRMRCQDTWCGGAIRGTDFTADYSGAGGALVLRVNRGRVDLAGPGSSQTVRIDAGHAAEVDAGGIRPMSSLVYPWWALPDERLMLLAVLLSLLVIGLIGVLLRRRGEGVARTMALPVVGVLVLLVGGAAAAVYSSALGSGPSAAASGPQLAVQSFTPVPTPQPPTPPPTPAPTPAPTPRPIDPRTTVIGLGDLRLGYASIGGARGIDCPACTYVSNLQVSYHHSGLQRDVISGVLVARSSSDAHANFAAMITKFHSNDASSAGLGDESYSYSNLFSYAGIRFFVVIWRSGVVTNFLELAAPDGTLSLQDGIALAQVQQQHVAAATGQ